MWSVGCIFAELLLKEPLFQAKGEVELISMIFKLLGPPTSSTWPEYSQLPLAKSISLPAPHSPQLRQKFPYITTAGLDLLSQLLAYDPESRVSAEEAMKHPYFRYVGCFTGIAPEMPTLDILVNHLCQSIPTCLDPSRLQLQEKSALYIIFDNASTATHSIL